jgi:hypothetical protein
VVLGILFMMMVLPMLQSDQDLLEARGSAISSAMYSMQLQLQGEGGNTTNPAFMRQLVSFRRLYPEVNQQL